MQLLVEVLSTKTRQECMTSSLKMVSIKKKWQIQANKHNASKQDRHYEKISADFILFPPYNFVVW